MAQGLSCRGFSASKQRYAVVTRLIGLDRKFFYIEHRFEGH
jgi:hypothetical protein